MSDNNHQPADQREVVLQVSGVTKRFPNVLANDDINLTLHRGEILALLGENGAGKSTLMNIIYGLYHADEGTITVKGQAVRFASPHEAIHAGIGMVHQHFQLIPVMTVAENVILGEEETVGRRKVARTVPTEDTPLAGTIRLVWGVLWRVAGVFVAIGVSLLVAQLLLLLSFVIGTYLVPTDTFDAPDAATLAQEALATYYPGHQALVTALVWLPLLVALIVGTFLVVRGLAYARRTWRGRARLAPHVSRVDAIIDSLIDLFATMTSVQDKQRAANRVHELSQQYGLEVDPDVVVEKLPVGAQQRVEIVKALYRHADILILDEPTAVLTPQEGQELFKIMRELASQGVSIIFITHKLKEVFAVADSIVVMRAGKVVGATTPGKATEESLAAMMVGRNVILRVAKEPAHPKDVVLSVTDLHAKDNRGAIAIDGVSFNVSSGEVLGIAGVQGNGQTELVEVLTGLQQPSQGVIRIQGHVYTHATPRAITNSGTAHVPEDRQRHGMIKTFPVAENLVLNRYYVSPFSTLPTGRELPLALLAYAVVFGVIMAIGAAVWTNAIWPAIFNGLQLKGLDPLQNDTPFLIALALTLISVVVWAVVDHLITIFLLRRLVAVLAKGGQSQGKAQKSEAGGVTLNEDAINDNARELVHEFDIRPPSIAVSGGNLSGGNQQKMIVAREFSRKPRLLIASQPTRGIDVGSIEFIHQRIINQRDEGAAVLLVSAELDEIMALSDRIAVMYKGRIIDTVDANTATREQLGLLMAGIKADAVPA